MASAGAEGAAATGGEAPQGGEGQGEAQSPDFAALIGEAQKPIEAQLEEVRNMLAASPLGQAPKAEAEAEPFDPAQADLSYLDPESQNYDATRAGQELLRMIGEQQNTAIQPLVQQLQQTQERLNETIAEQQYRDLAARIPDLEDDSVAEETFKRAGEWVSTLGLPQDQAARLAQSPQVIEAVYKIGRVSELANEESSEQPRAATLEGGGGATPAAPAEGVLTADSIVKAGGRSVLPI